MDHIRQIFPALNQCHHAQTSNRDTRYNCIAWAAGDVSNWWEPSPFTFWPNTVAREYTLSAYISAFRTLGYQRDADAAEDGEKVALFVDAGGKPTHAARLKRNGFWTSKCGRLEDIEHELEGIEGDAYGTVAVILVRPWNS